ncbi:MAG: peptidyl-prolyl cis-trans isomerase [Deltaproteobacteria bacterium]|nr:peptidyl-prolyl cis-trans isomerase [Deltaproteobacteria bacterium]
MHRPIFVIVVVAFAAVAAGLPVAGVATEEQATAAAPAQPEPSADAVAADVAAAEETAGASDQERRAKVLAKVGSRTLTVGDFEDQLSSPRNPVPTRARYADPEQVRREFDERIERMVIAAWAEHEGIDRRADVLRDIRKLYRGITLYRHVSEAVTDESVTDAEVAAFYEEHRDWYNRPETVKAGLILLPDRPQAEAALVRALAAKGNRAELVRIVRELSTDEESKLQNGTIGVFDRDGKINRAQGHDQPEPPPVDPAIVAAAFTLSTPYDVYPQVVDTARGPAVVFLYNRTEAVTRTVEEVASRIRPELLKQRRDAAADAFLAEVRGRYHVTVHDEAFEHVVVAPAPPEALSPHGGMFDEPPGVSPMTPPRVITPAP